MTDDAKIATIVAGIERAAKALHPLVIGGDVEVAKAAHDALNALTAARANAELLALSKGATS